MKRYTKIAVPLLILIVGFVAMQLLLGLRDEEQKAPAKPKPRTVDVMEVDLTDVPSQITAYGRVSSARPIELYSEVAGIVRDGDVPFKPAQSFSRGDLILRIDDRQARFKLNSARSELLTALASVLPEIKVDFPSEYDVWQDYFDRCEFKGHIPELPESSNRKIKLFLSRFNVYKLYFNVRDLEVILDKHYFYAPFNGSIVATNVREGTAARNGSLLGEIISLDELEVEVQVSAQDIQWIRNESQAEITSKEIDGFWGGRVIRTSSAIDDKTQTVSVTLAVERGDLSLLRSGVFVEVSIPGLMIENAIRMPRRALYGESDVYVIENGKFSRREVDIARSENGFVIINGGLAAGDSLVVQLMQGVIEGMPAIGRSANSEGRSE